MFVTFAAALFVQESPRLDQPINFVCPGASVRDMATQLEKESGVSIRIGASLNRDTLVVSFRSKTTRHILTEICATLAADWKLQDGVITLSRSDQQERRQFQEERELRIAAIRKWQEKPMPEPWSEERARQIVNRAETIATGYHPTNHTRQKWEQMRALSADTPDTRASLLARKHLNLSELTNVVPGRRIVISSRPNAMQKSLSGVNHVFTEFARQQAMFLPLAQASLARVPNAVGLRDPRFWAGRKDAQPDRIIFTAYDLPGSPSINLRCYLVAGTAIVCMTSEAAPLHPEALPALPIAKFEAPSAAQEFFRAFSRSDREKLRATLKNRPDPAAWTLGPTLIEYAKARKVDLVASIPDPAIESAVVRGPDKDGYSFLGGLPSYLKWEERDGTLRMSPRLPVTNRSAYLDRRRFYDFFDELRRKGHITFEATADYLKDMPLELPTANLHQVALREATGQDSGAILDQWVSPAFRFWGRLTASQRGGKSRVADLPPAARSALYDWFFNTTVALQFSNINPADSEAGIQISRLEPSELFPNGIPDDLMIQCDFGSVPVLFYDSGEHQSSNRIEHSGWLHNLIEEPVYRFASGSSRTLTLKFGEGPLLQTLEFDEPGRMSNKWVKGSELDPSLRDRIKEQHEKDKREATPVTRQGPPPELIATKR